ncbi:MAG TPA: RNA polymerase sigma factor [Acidimicrobiales bacterium]|nr:RNA polymerase sigma factor [Acidimicrobiales bacterium]
MHDQLTDRDLLARLPADRAAFEELYRRHVDRVVGFAARRVHQPADVADVVADTFVTVLTSCRGYDPGRGEPTAWLLGIAARLIANRRRRRHRERLATGRIAGRRLLDADDVDRLADRIDAARATDAVARAMDHLKPPAREALLLVGADGLTPAEAAQVVGISAAAFRMRLTGARRALARAMDAAGPGPPGGPPVRPDTATTPVLKEALP